MRVRKRLKLNPGILITCAAVGLWAEMATPVGAAELADRPNVLLILVDDLGYGDLASQGARDMRTPHIDRLAASGMTFTNFYANCPVCSPTRAALLSGRYQDLVGVPGVIRTHQANSWGYLRHDAVLLPVPLAKAGYHTAMVGKWHLGLDAPNLPNDRGFTHFHGFLGDMMDDYYNHRRHGNNYMRKNAETIDPKGHATDLFSQWAVDYLELAARRRDRRPFFLYLAYNAPHTPIQPPEEWVQRVLKREPKIDRRRAKLVALIEHMDDGIGKVLKALEANGQAKNTLVVFTSDNGGQLNAGANNGPLRDGKQSVYEGGLKVPTCVSWPGRIKPGSRSDLMALSMDLFPTVCQVAGAELPGEIEGRSVVPTLLGKSQPPLRDLWFFSRREGGARYAGKTIEAVRRGPWKLLHNSPFAPLELYNLERDPREEIDLAKKNPRVFREMSAALRRQLQRYGAVPWQKPE
ncbi:MAG: sulfatase-like hydrolase/transferase [Planctomycetota bacterium]|nr:sulfatase-like hydrolase/transferase [Planctomycetota bacterium]